MQLELDWYNNIDLDLTYRSGNTELLTIQTRYRTDYLNLVYHGFAFGSIQYGKEGDSFFTNKGIAHGRIIRNVVNHIQLESFVQKQFNESIYLNDRNLIGGGFRFAVLPSKSKYNLYLGIGGMWNMNE